MKTHGYLGLLVGGALLQACAARAPDADTEQTGRTVSPLKTQAIAVPSYFPEASIWSTMAGQAPPAKVAIINPNSGPNGSYNANNITTAQNRGMKVVGYVYTSAAARDPVAVKTDIDTYFRNWPALDGIFFDEMNRVWDAASACGSSDTYYPYYLDLGNYARLMKTGAITIFNPGSALPSCYLNVGDIFMTFEGTGTNYLNAFVTTNRDWETEANSSRVWHAIYDATATQMPQVIAASGSRQAGYVYVTDRTLAQNAWRDLPSYWAAEAATVTTAISSYSASNTATTITYQANFAFSFPYKHVFIDTDNNSGTGYVAGGVGAEFMIENDKVYSMTRSVWNPVEIGSSGRTGAPGGQSGVTTWTISRSTIGETAPSGERSTIVFNGSGTGTNSYYTPIVVHSFTP